MKNQPHSTPHPRTKPRDPGQATPSFCSHYLPFGFIFLPPSDRSMKLILTGTTGFVGAEVLNQCLANASIDSIIVLSRRTLPSSSTHPKLKVLVLDDFTDYSGAVLEELAGAEGCIWYFALSYSVAARSFSTTRIISGRCLVVAFVTVPVCHYLS